jgi:Ni/Fe-hydrogenase subunit HybB-like protein
MQPGMTPVIEPRRQTDGSVTDRIAGLPLQRFGYQYLMLLGFASALVMVLLTAIAWLMIQGVGIWGIQIPNAWGFAIINFVWWIGIGHAGTLISAILLLKKQKWRNSINRLAEAMTLFAVANAGLFPLLHLGRIQRFYYILPYPSTMDLWPQWRSPLTWDVVAVLTYGTVSLLFWYLGLVPDLASMRDLMAPSWKRRVAGFFALGWRGSARHWQRHQMLYLLLAGLATPLVVSVHSIVSLDFAVAMLPGWHSAIFPPYFVAGAIFSGFAMVVTIAVPVRKVFHFEDFITERHLNNMAKVMLVSGLVVDYGYLMEWFTTWFSGDKFEWYMAVNRIIGPYWPIFALTMLCNVIAPQFLWSRRFRVNPWLLFVISQFVNVGMWVERYMIIITSLHRDYMPSSWGIYHGTIWDWATFIGTLGFFLLLILLFIRFCPIISIYELRELMLDNKREGHQPDGLAQAVPAPMSLQPAESQAPPPLAEHVLWGVAAEFADSDTLLAAIARVREAGYVHFDAYTPLPLENLPHAMGARRTWVPLIVLIGGVLGAASAYGFQWWTSVIDYPWDIGGRPYHSWPSFIPLTFEFGVLCASLAGFFGTLALNRLPWLYHPIFNAPGFERATRDRFFLCIEARDASFDREQVTALLLQTQPLRVSEVAR